MSCVLGSALGEAPGPTLLVVCGLHGNEPAGVEAATRLLSLKPHSGELVVLAGNLPALAKEKRFLVRDLNRQWTEERIAAVCAGTDPEARAFAELAAEIAGAIARARGPVFALDLHTSSSEGIPFAILGPTKADRAFAAQLALPSIAGLQEKLEGVLTSWLASRGCVALAIEGGQNENAASVENLHAVALLALVASGLFAASELPGVESARARLVAARGDLPALIEVVERHEIAPEEEFQMLPGFINIQRTAAGTLLARNRGGEIRAPFDGFVLLPLYQPQGHDGFFYGRAG